MKLTLAINIGSHDAKRLKLRSTQEGDVVTVDDEIGGEMIGRKWAVPFDDKPKPVAAPAGK